MRVQFYFIFIFLFDPSWSESIRVDPTRNGGPSWSGPTFVPAWPKVVSQKLIWSGEIYYTNIVVLDLFWRWEVKIRFLRNNAFHCVFIRLHGNTFSNLKTSNLSHKLSKQTTRQPSISFFIEDHRQIIVTTNDSENRLSFYADWLRGINHTIWYRGYHV